MSNNEPVNLWKDREYLFIDDSGLTVVAAPRLNKDNNHIAIFRDFYTSPSNIPLKEFNEMKMALVAEYRYETPIEIEFRERLVSLGNELGLVVSDYYYDLSELGKAIGDEIENLERHTREEDEECYPYTFNWEEQ